MDDGAQSTIFIAFEIVVVCGALKDLKATNFNMIRHPPVVTTSHKTCKVGYKLYKSLIDLSNQYPFLRQGYLFWFGRAANNFLKTSKSQVQSKKARWIAGAGALAFAGGQWS